ncbi:two component transcriptional regulator, winged helix family [Dehalogenimonas alkenigignens]|uniref:Two component transcriptional regulator, winged helix family n=1 Tax=Dehalogenimonas alkenigignens TaxID=1217799 RepID=A0A0W0GK85_9CHLR|nr:response regulator transcription factor [Dehalogenimonas alkenigignens]KTB48952.1 two component transcriptional regulator, winged helix family [Dehalogenimonas alkenigignens]
MRILVVEDERRLAQIIKRGLEEAGYAVDSAFDGLEGQALAESASYDLIILDVMLPKQDGIKTCLELRNRKIGTPVLMLTARDAVEDRVAGLDAGADDYMIKPFAFSELLARVRALLRRGAPLNSSPLAVADLELDTATRTAVRGGRRIELTSREYAILEYLMRHPGILITRTMLEERVWDYQSDRLSNVIDVYIKKLRNKIDQPGQPSLIKTIRGAGYRMEGK